MVLDIYGIQPAGRIICKKVVTFSQSLDPYFGHFKKGRVKNKIFPSSVLSIRVRICSWKPCWPSRGVTWGAGGQAINMADNSILKCKLWCVWYILYTSMTLLSVWSLGKLSGGPLGGPIGGPLGGPFGDQFGGLNRVARPRKHILKL